MKKIVPSPCLSLRPGAGQPTGAQDHVSTESGEECDVIIWEAHNCLYNGHAVEPNRGCQRRALDITPATTRLGTPAKRRRPGRGASNPGLPWCECSLLDEIDATVTLDWKWFAQQPTGVGQYEGIGTGQDTRARGSAPFRLTHSAVGRRRRLSSSHVRSILATLDRFPRRKNRLGLLTSSSWCEKSGGNALLLCSSPTNQRRVT